MLACLQLLLLDHLQMCALQITHPACDAWHGHKHRTAEKPLGMTCRLFRIQCAKTDRPHAQWRSNGSPFKLVPKQHLWRPASALARLHQQALQQHMCTAITVISDEKAPVALGFFQTVSNNHLPLLSACAMALSPAYP